jgi:antitoxin HicB
VKKGAITAVELAYVCHFQPEPEGGYTATCPSLPPVVTYGETLDEARQNAREAIELCLEVLKEDGRPIPQPIAIPAGAGQSRYRHSADSGTA